MSTPRVQLHIEDQHVVMDNGILQVTLSNPGGIVTGIQFNGMDNLLEVLDEESNRGFWDLVWSEAGSIGTTGTFDVFEGTSFKGKFVSLNLDKRFIMLRNSSGFYSYAIFEHLADWPPFNLPQTRIVFKLRKDKFHYMVVADNRQRFMPLPDDRLPVRGEPLDFPEAVLLVDPVEPEFKGEVDDKYQYSCENRDLHVHGWICFDPPTGFWQITPSSEFRSGGPLKQNLTSHVGPYTLAMFLSAHYAGEDLIMHFPCGMMLKNSIVRKSAVGHTAFQLLRIFHALINVVKISGRLQVQDRYISHECIAANNAYVGLAPPGDVGSWQRECKGYQFWTKTDGDGSFSIGDIRTGDYNIYAWVPGFIGDYRNDTVITVTAGCEINVGDLVYEPPRDGPTVWEIGIPDRSAAEFYIPDPNPKYINKLFINHPDRFRQYGLWERKIGFFAQVNRKKDDGTFEGTTWQIKFELDDVDQSGAFKLRLALATANVAELQVRINDPKIDPPHFSTGEIGHDNTISRHGIHGLYRLYNVDVPGATLVEGDNTVFLTQTISTSPLQGVMYDYIRLEGPPPPDSK
ncbi:RHAMNOGALACTURONATE LYASE B-RELATED [Salix purpurea]|uniref:rhamnogalacturonan endolyase n=1 Tax=Salix purpurea TaxID=77065 RepID=A0A9Q0PCX6_SALPP|nr:RHAMNOGALACTURONATE LYASE B-RELATED [Salix purpurea]